MRTFLVLLGFLAATVGTIAKNDDVIPSLLSKAERHYKQAQYAAAIASYDSLLRLDVQDVVVYHNLGNSYFKSGKLGLSKLQYERGLLLDPADGGLRHNLAVVNARLLDRVESVPQLFIVEWWNGLKEGYSIGTIFGWSVIVLVLLAAAAVFYYWTYELWQKRLAFFCAIALAIGFLSIVALMLDTQEDRSAHRMAIIMESAVTARSTPDRSGVEAFTIHEGLKVEVLDRDDTWCKIRLADGKVGWLHTSTLERI